MKILFVGGGTGGHFYPLIAVAEALRRSGRNPDLYYMGPDEYNLAALQENNIKFVYCPAGKRRIYASAANFFDLFKTGFGLFLAFIKLYIIYPDVVFSKGGYTSVPVLLAARFFRIPVVIHESDAVPGRANLLAKKFARYIGIAYDEVATHFDASKLALVGIPIRENLKIPVSDPHSQLGIPNDLPLIYITGGSLGSENINNLILQSLQELLQNFRIFHQTGTNHEALVASTASSLLPNSDLLSRYYVKGSVDGNMVNLLLSAASLVISRAGSTTIFEIALHGKPSIIIPIPESISRDQKSNAYAFARAGGCSVLEEQNLTKALLLNQIQSIMGNPTLWQEMSQAALRFAPKDADQKIANLLLSIGDEHHS